MENSNNVPKLNIAAQAEDLMGRYSNVFTVTVQERDVAIDFFPDVSMPDGRRAQLVSRVFLNHFTAKELAETIMTTHAKWEGARFEGKK